MENIINIDAYRGLSDEEIQKMVCEGNGQYYAVFGKAPKEGEPKTVTIKRELDKISFRLASIGFLKEKYSIEDLSGSALEIRRAEEEYAKYIQLQGQYLEEERKEDEKYSNSIGLTPSDHNELLYKKWETKQKHN